jgi:hypothetical protein
LDKFVGQPSDPTFTGDRLQKNRRNTFDFRLNGMAAGWIGGIEKPNLGAINLIHKLGSRGYSGFRDLLDLHAS